VENRSKGKKDEKERMKKDLFYDHVKLYCPTTLIPSSTRPQCDDRCEDGQAKSRGRTWADGGAPDGLDEIAPEGIAHDISPAILGPEPTSALGSHIVSALYVRRPDGLEHTVTRCECLIDPRAEPLYEGWARGGHVEAE
jgi:hypothetical protein